METPEDPPLSVRRAAARALGVVLAVAIAASCTGGDPTDPRPPRTSPASVAPSGSDPPPSGSDPPPPFRLELQLRDLRSDGVGGRIPRGALGEPARDVRAVLNEFYSIAFVDPARWDGGGFAPLFRLFASDVRTQAEQDLADLTLGPAARSVESVRPVRAEIDVRFLADRGDRALVAVSRVVFSGIARAGEDRATVHHTGEYVLRRLDGGWRIVAYEVHGEIPPIAGAGRRRMAASSRPVLTGGDQLFVLVIGSDARPGQSVTRTRADSLHIVAVNRRSGAVSILGIPRDSWVPIPGAGTDKINAALTRGGPELVVDTVERLSGVPIDAYLLTGFDGFRRAVAAIGGLDIRIPYAISDRYAHAQFRPGPEHLTAREALAFSRARHDLRDGDFARSLNQGRLIVAALATLRDQLERGRAVLLRWALAGAVHLRTDLSIEEMFDLVAAASSFEPRRVRNRVVPGRIGSIAGKSVVLLDAGARAMFRDLARDAILGG